MDENLFEIANLMVEKEIEAGISVIRKRAHSPPQRTDKKCVSCAEEIPPKRAALGYSRCVPCQKKAEQ